MPLIRPSQPADMAQITAIYQHHVLHGTGTFEIDPPSLADMTARREDVLSKGLPYLVLEDQGKWLVLPIATGSNHALPTGFQPKIPSTWPPVLPAEAGGACFWPNCARPPKKQAFAN